MPRKTFYKSITSPELTEKINPENLKLLDEFIREKDRKCSLQTLAGYKSDLNLFYTWNLLHNNNKHFPEIKKREFANFFNFGMTELQWKSARFSRVRSVLSSFSDFFCKYYDEDYPTYRPIIKTVIESIPKTPSRKKTVLSEEQVDSLLLHLKESDRPQEALLLAVAISSGMRIGELVQMTTDLIDENNTAFDDVFLETTDEIRTKGSGKEGYRITKFFIKDLLLPYYKTWLPIRERILKEQGQEHNALFIKRNGTPADLFTFRQWQTKWEKFLDVDLYFHAYRKYTVTHLTRIGLSQDFIIEIIGWRSGDAMYRLYCDLTAKDKKWKDTDKLAAYLATKENEKESEGLEQEVSLYC